MALQTDDHLDWRRPHPLTILVEIGRAIRSVVIALVVVSGGVLNEAAYLEGALVAAPLVAALARWYTTRYAIDAESVYHQHGLIWRTKQVLPRSNIQNVSTKAGLLARMGSVLELQISDASATGDIRLRYVAREEADRLATLLRSSLAPAPVADGGSGLGGPGFPPAPVTIGADQPGGGVAAPPGAGLPGVDPAGGDQPGAGQPGADIASTTGHPAPPPSGAAVERAPLVEPTLGELLRAELTAASSAQLAAFFVAAAIAVAVGIQTEVLTFDVVGSRSPWLLFSGAVVAVAFLVAVGVVQRLLVLGGFRLFADPDRLRIEAGLITLARVAARRERIQQLRVIRDVTHRRLGIERIGFETADLEAEGTAGTGFFAPIAPAGTWRAMAAEVFGETQLDEADLQPVSPLTARRVFVRFVVVAVPLAALGFVNLIVAAIVVAVWLGAGWVYSRRRYRELGWARSADQYLVRSGVVYGRLTLVRLDKVQSARLSSTFFQRRLDLATVRISTAGRGFGGLVSLPDLPRPVAEELLAAIARRANETPIADTL